MRIPANASRPSHTTPPSRRGIRSKMGGTAEKTTKSMVAVLPYVLALDDGLLLFIDLSEGVSIMQLGRMGVDMLVLTQAAIVLAHIKCGIEGGAEARRVCPRLVVVVVVVMLHVVPVVVDVGGEFMGSGG